MSTLEALILAQETPTSEEFVRAFAEHYPTPNTVRALSLCERGALRWDDVAGLYGTALAAGLHEVKA